MGVAIGSKLGSYEITSLLGKGGMGEVYRARDTKLKRDVAIKVITEEFTRDADRVNRFQREAEVLASLSHPNIAAIHHLEQVDGTPFLILELVEGETLADRIARGPLFLDNALAIARQIAQAVEAAHSKAIVHRDLKPANVKVTPDGKVKVLDFGLAKIYETQPTSAEFSQSPTLVSGTLNGVLIGTAAYMSPEQARGQNADRQSDIWAFGCILYEMLSGKPAFAGNTIADILAAIMKTEPDWTSLPAGTPSRVRLLLQRCLQKDRARRLRDIGDAVLEIDSEEPAIAEQEHGRNYKAPLAWLIAGVVITLAAVLGITSFNRKAPSPQRTLHFTIPPPGHFFIRGQNAQFALSPDGRYLAFMAEGGTRSLWIRPLDSAQATPIAAATNGSLPFWSADSRYIGFWQNQQLKKWSIADGQSQVIGNAAGFPEATWNSKDVIIFSGDGTLYRIAGNGSNSEAIVAPDASRKETQIGAPQFLPDGDHFLFAVIGDDPQAAGLWVMSLASRDRKRLLSTPVRAKYSPATGDLLYIRDGHLIKQPFDILALELKGTATILKLDSSDDGAIGSFDISADGILVWNARPASAARLVWRDRTGNKTNVALDPGLYRQIRLSPDGTKAAVNLIAENQSQVQDIWLLELTTGVFSRITSGQGQANDPVWSPDGRQIAFQWRGNLYRRMIGSPEIIPILETPVSKWLHDWSRDGRSVVLAYDRGVYILSPESGSMTTFLEDNFNKDEFRVSPDGRWIAYNSDESGRHEIYVASFPKLDNRRQVSNSGGTIPRWRADMREMYYMRPDGSMMAVEVRNGELLQTGSPQPLFGTDIPVSSVLDQYDVTSDGQKFLIIENEENAVSPPIHVAVNWANTQQ
jgi:Tol biopolymer transport system component